HTATLEAADTEDDVSEGISGSSSMNPTSTDWSEIMEHEEATENQQKELETNDLRPENSTAMGMEGSGNLYDERSGDVGPPDLHGGIKANKLNQQYKKFKETKQNQSAKKKAPEPSQKTDDERPENPYKNNNQGPEVQGNITIEQDVHIVEIDLAPDTEKGQPNINEENSSLQNLSRQEIVTGKKDVQISESVLCKKSETKFRNSDHLLVWCSLYQNQETPKPILWKLNPRMLNNTFISKELEADLKDKKATSDWDYYKIRCQSIYRACKPPTTPETLL
ncbi:905_t:CDS:2, partial [Gigaspora margarita]